MKMRALPFPQRGCIIGEQKAKMARRPNTGSRERLTAEQLADFRQRLSTMTRHEVEILYKATHNACRYEVNGRVPSPRIMQELVQTWKQLRKVG